VDGRRPGSLSSSSASKDGKLAEHWDVLQDEATKAQSKSGLRCSAIASRIDLPPSLDEGQMMKLSGNTIFITGSDR